MSIVGSRSHVWCSLCVQVSEVEDDLLSPTNSQSVASFPSYSPSPTPHHSTLHPSTLDQSGAMPTDTADSTLRTPATGTHTIRELKKLADHDK